MKKFLLFFFLLLTLFSCEFKDVDFIGIEGVNVVKFDQQELVVNLAFKLNNENGFKIKVKPSKLNVFVDGVDMGTVFLDKKIVFKKKSENIYTTKLRFELADGAMISAVKFRFKKEWNVRLVGKVKGSVFGFSKKFRVDKTKTITADQLNLEHLLNQ